MGDHLSLDGSRSSEGLDAEHPADQDVDDVKWAPSIEPDARLPFANASSDILAQRHRGTEAQGHRERGFRVLLSE